MAFTIRVEKGHVMDYQSIIQELDGEIAKLEQARALLKPNGNVVAAIKRAAGRKTVARKPKKHVMSAEARKRIGDAQRKRWAKAKKAKRTAPAKVKKATKKAATEVAKTEAALT